MRLFIAIQLSGEMKSALRGVQEQMRSQHITGNYVPSENLHLTLAFIGEYSDPDRILLPPVAPFDLHLQGFGNFDDLWWAGVAPLIELRRYAVSLRHILSYDGIPFDRKRFSPHITLIRRAVGVPAVEVPRAGMTVDHVSLMRSDRGKRGMIYTELRRSEPFAEVSFLDETDDRSYHR